MARPRVTQAMRRRLREARDSRTGLARRGGIGLLPTIIEDPDVWSRLAEPMQAELVSATVEDRQPYTSLPPPKEPDDAAIQREHERQYQEYRAKAAEGGMPLVEALRRKQAETMR